MVILATSGPLESTQVPGHLALLTFAAKMIFFWQTARLFRRRQPILRATQYLSLERGLSILALIFFSLDVYLLDLRYYLGLVPFSEQVPALEDLSGMLVFLSYLVILWLELKNSYERVFRVRQDKAVFLINKFRLCFALILPWLVFHLLHDIFVILPGRGVLAFMESVWGEAVFFLILVVFCHNMANLVRKNCRQFVIGLYAFK